MSVGIIIVNWNNKHDTIECLESLEKVKTPHEVILVDNGSQSEINDFFVSHYPLIHHIRSEKNTGFTGGNNLGLEYALKRDLKAVILLNNDTIVEPNFIDAFLKEHERHPKAILGAQIINSYNRKITDHFGGNWDQKKLEFTLFAKQIDVNHPSIHTLASLDYVIGCCMFIPLSVVKKIGLLDSRYFLYWEDADYCYLAKENNIPIYYCPSSKIYHKCSQSISGKTHAQYYFERNRLLWMKKHLAKKEFYYFVIISLLPKLFHHMKRIIQLLLQQLFTFSSKKRKTKKIKVRSHCAAIQGFFDAIFYRFGEGPKWITKNPT